MKVVNLIINHLKNYCRCPQNAASAVGRTSLFELLQHSAQQHSTSSARASTIPRHSANTERGSQVALQKRRRQSALRELLAAPVPHTLVASSGPPASGVRRQRTAPMAGVREGTCSRTRAGGGARRRGRGWPRWPQSHLYVRSRAAAGRDRPRGEALHGAHADPSRGAALQA